ncbi:MULTISPECIES: hypothetical protein [Gracilibacillus]|uniref:hypothetical protein n=1 Tax=Gracilibacillus TaxID=74385 RepID=UPI00082436DC|nr:MULTISPECIES: hypothetical protein [Gracilibacillus]
MTTHAKKEMHLFVKFFIVFIVFATLLIILWIFLKADYQGEILEIENNHITLGPTEVDNEADYNVYTIVFNDKTKIEGTLNIGSYVKVWGKSKEDIIRAEKITVMEND